MNTNKKQKILDKIDRLILESYQAGAHSANRKSLIFNASVKKGVKLKKEILKLIDKL